jgi:hypothetical protein
MSLLNQFLNGLNQNRNLRTGFYPVEKNPVFTSVKCRQDRPFKRNLNRFVRSVFASSRAVMMIADRT